MPTSVTPSSLLLHQFDLFLSLIPAVRDGDTDAIHDARVATRRIRELLPLSAARFTPSDLEHIDAAVRRVASRLGRARDLDVRLELLTSLERAVPSAATTAAQGRAHWMSRRDTLVKRAIKSMERVDIAQVVEQARLSLRHQAPLLFAVRRHVSAADRWEDLLAAQMRQRAGDVTEALQRAGGLSFPNRLHRLRIALKKLRYSMEIASETGRGAFSRELRGMKKAQELLGRIHDHDVLADALRDERLGQSDLQPLVEFRRRELHARYLRRRAGILEVCARAARSASRHHRSLAGRRAAVVATLPLAVLAVPLLRRASRREARDHRRAPASASEPASPFERPADPDGYPLALSGGVAKK
jgi:CHAD domain-containing protein